MGVSFFEGDVPYCVPIKRGCGETSPLEYARPGSEFPTLGTRPHVTLCFLIHLEAIYFSGDFFVYFCVCLFFFSVINLFWGLFSRPTCNRWTVSLEVGFPSRHGKQMPEAGFLFRNRNRCWKWVSAVIVVLGYVSAKSNPVKCGF